MHYAFSVPARWEDPAGEVREGFRFLLQPAVPDTVLTGSANFIDLGVALYPLGWRGPRGLGCVESEASRLANRCIGLLRRP